MHGTQDPDKRLSVVTRKIGRLVDALTSGSEELPSVRAALAELERERAALEERLRTAHRRGSEGSASDVTGSSNS